MVSTCGECTILLGKLEGERLRGRPYRQWLGNVKAWTGINLYETTTWPVENVSVELASTD